MSTRKLKGSTGGCQCCYLIVSFPAVWVLPVDEWNSMKHSQVCVLHNPYTGLSASSSICMWSITNNRKPHSKLYSCVSKNKYCCLLGSVLKVSALVTLLLLPHKHYVYCLYDMQGSKMSLPRLHVHAHDSFSFCVLAGHTSSSPTSYSTSHTETNSSGVPLIRTYVRTWFTHHIFLYLSNCVQKVTYGTSKGDPTCTRVPGWAKLFAETVALLWQKENVKFHIVWRTSVNSGLCV